ncbi:hypothetical protein BOTNAR_0121g00200 [Botryotinia narcissicola]|uniref:Uncharacterized protein n=1 Tax=Botryotinia narcissicola TaxID=278944 RepID=A0A4Z1IMY6_9HELO|nr:hypothetical protein BOTNAR_0121g00200 [Botryotinia narcissicola]
MHSLRRVFALVQPKPWLYPVRFLRMKIWRKKTTYTEDGLKWFGIIWAAVFQFCVVKFLGALVKCITEAAGVYCEESSSFKHGRVWTKVVLAERNPLLKLVAIKLVVFLFYVQSFIFGRLTTEDGKLQPTDKISYPSVSAGIPNTLLCVEMAGVAVLHLWAYPWQEYGGKMTRTSESPSSENMMHFSSQQTSLPLPWWQALVHVLSFGDVLKGIVEGFHGLRSSRRNAIMAHYVDAGIEGRASPYSTKDLSEALDLVHRSPDEH